MDTGVILVVVGKETEEILAEAGTVEVETTAGVDEMAAEDKGAIEEDEGAAEPAEEMPAPEPSRGPL